MKRGVDNIKNDTIPYVTLASNESWGTLQIDSPGCNKASYLFEEIKIKKKPHTATYKTVVTPSHKISFFILYT
jgi:hypothetical protein